MPRRPKTVLDRYFAEQMKKPGFTAGYRAARAEISATDHLIRSLEAARVSSGLTKAELARKVGFNRTQVERLLASAGGDPNLETAVKVTTALAAYLEFGPSRSKKTPRPKPLSSPGARTRKPR